MITRSDLSHRFRRSTILGRNDVKKEGRRKEVEKEIGIELVMKIDRDRDIERHSLRKGTRWPLRTNTFRIFQPEYTFAS